MYATAQREVSLTLTQLVSLPQKMVLCRSLGELDQVNILTEKIDEFLGDDKETISAINSKNKSK